MDKIKRWCNRFVPGFVMGVLVGALIGGIIVSQMANRYQVVQKQMVMSSGATRQVLYRVDKLTGRAWRMSEGHWLEVAQNSK